MTHDLNKCNAQKETFPNLVKVRLSPACVLCERAIWKSDQRYVVSDVLHVVVRVGDELRRVDDLPAALGVVEVVGAEVDVGTHCSEHQH